MIQLYDDGTFEEFHDGESVGFGDVRDVEPDTCPVCHGYGMVDARTDCVCQSGPATIEPAHTWSAQLITITRARPWTDGVPTDRMSTRELVVTAHDDGTGWLAIYAPSDRDLFDELPCLDVALPAEVVTVLWRGLVAETATEPMPNANDTNARSAQREGEVTT